MALGRPEYVSDLVVWLLNGLGVEYTPLNPGATTRGIHESIVNYGGNQAPEIITCVHEELAVAMCEGYYLATGRPQATLVHNIVGLQHASKAIYEAFLSQIPMIIIGGTGPLDASHRRPWIDWIHTAQVQAQIVRDYVKWDDQPLGAESVAESVLRAYQIAMTEPRGPVYLCFDVELQESLLPDGFQLPDLSRFQPPATPWGDEDAISQAAEALLQAEWPVLMVEGLGRTPGASDALAGLADLLAVPTIEVGTAFNLPNSHPMNLTGANAEALQDADLVISVDVPHLEQLLTRPATEAPGGSWGLPRAGSGHTRRFESILRDDVKLVRVGLEDYGAKAWTASYGRLLPADVSILGKGSQVLKSLGDKCREGQDAAVKSRVEARRPRVTEIHDGIYRRAQQDLRDKWWDQQPIATARLSAEVWEAVKDEDWVLVHGSLSGWERRLWDVSDAERWVAGGGGTGTGMGVAMGAALAFRGTGKLCVSFQQDGDLLYTGGSMWTAAHHQIPMLVVMFNNQSYYQDIGHQSAVSRMRERSLETVGVGVNLQGPVTDFANLARCFNLYGDGPVTAPEEIAPALQRGINVVKNEGRLALVDTLTQPR